MRASCLSSTVAHWSARILLLEILEMLGVQMTCCWFFFWQLEGRYIQCIYIYIYCTIYIYIFISESYIYIYVTHTHVHIYTGICGSWSWRYIQQCRAMGEPLSSERNTFGGSLIMRHPEASDHWSATSPKTLSKVTWWWLVCATVPEWLFVVICGRSTT